jgi:N utilization substance protein B
MASNRHLGRIIALQTLYEVEFRREAGDVDLDIIEVLDRNVGRYREMVDDIDFIRLLVEGVSNQAEELDLQLQPVAPEWPIDQIARMDRIVLRIGLYELVNEADVPPKVVINEAVELAKAFGGENSSKFVNGVLGTVLRDQETKGLASAEVPDKKAAKTSSKKPTAKTKAIAKKTAKKATGTK